MKFAIASLSLLLAACTAPQPPVEPTPAPAATPLAEAPAPQSAPMAKRAPGQENVEPLQIFRAFGTEPFWNVNAEGDTLTFITPEDQDGVVMRGERHPISGGVEIAGNHNGKAFTLTISAGTCSDGMLDNQYKLVSDFRYGDIEYKGCGEAAK